MTATWHSGGSQADLEFTEGGVLSKRIVAICFAVIWAVSAQSAFCRDDASDVYDAVTASAPDGCPVIVASRTEIRGIDETLARKYAQMLNLNESLAKSFAAANSDARAIPWKPANSRVVFLEGSVVPDAGVDAALLEEARKTHPCARYAFSFSAVAVLHEEAMVKVNRFCGSLCGGGSDIVRLALVSGHWQVVKWSMLEIN